MTLKGFDQNGLAIDLKIASGNPSSALADSQGNVTGTTGGLLKVLPYPWSSPIKSI